MQIRLGSYRATGGKFVAAILKHAVLIFASIIMLFPFLWMLSTALKESSQIFAYPPVFIPKPVVWYNFVEAFNKAPFLLYFWNTFKVSILTVGGAIFVSSLAAYAFARLRFKYNDLLFNILLLTMMIPYTVRVIPLYSMMRGLHWINSHWALIVPPVLSDVYGMFMLRQFMKGIPMELDEAARVDGATSFFIYSRIIMPLSKSGIATLALFTFKTAWNQFLPALIFINNQRRNLITVGLTVFRGEFETSWNYMMGGAFIAVLPVIILYLITQRFFVAGVAMTGVKG